jgi:hypothetical protein
MFLHEDDVELIRVTDVSRPEEEYIVFDESDRDEQEIVSRVKPEKREVATYTPSADYMDLYERAQKAIVKKDEVIQDLAYRLGKSESELKSSIPLAEYKKTTFLLESAKAKTDSDAIVLSDKIGTLEKELNKRNSAILGLAILFISVLLVSVVFFVSTQFSL